MGLGEGSWDAAPLSGSRGLSSGWAHQSSLRRVSSRISEIMGLDVGKGDAMQGRLQNTAQTTGAAGGTGRDREFTLYLSVQEHTARRSDRVHELLHLPSLILLSQPRVPRRARSSARSRSAAPRGSAPSLGGVSDRHLVPQVRHHCRGRRQTGLWN